MTYTRLPTRIAHRRNGRGMGNMFDDIASGLGFKPPSQAQACIDRANASSQVKAIDGQVESLARSWKPTGYYRPADIRALLDTLATEAAAAGAALAAAPNSTSDAVDMKRQAFADLDRRYKARAVTYERAYAQAMSSGANVIDGPSVKDWVISSMRAISDAYVTATVMHCMQSWVEAALDRAYKAMATIGSVAYRIVGIAVKIGDTVLKAADDILDLYPIIKIGALGVAALFAFKIVRERWRK